MPFFRSKRRTDPGERLKDLTARIRQRTAPGSLGDLFAAFDDKDYWPGEEPPAARAPTSAPAVAQRPVAERPAAAESTAATEALANTPDPTRTPEEVDALATELAAYLARIEAEGEASPDAAPERQ